MNNYSDNNANKSDYKIYGLIGFGLMAYHYYYHRTDSYSIIMLLGYTCLTLAFVPWYFKNEITHSANSEIPDKNKEKLMKKLGYTLITFYYLYKITYKVDLHLILGIIAHGSYLTQWKKYSYVLLLAYYTESLFHGYGNIGLTSIMLYYYFIIQNKNH